MKQEGNNKEYSTSSYLTPKIKKFLSLSSVFKIVSSLILIFSIGTLLYGGWILFSAKKYTWLIVGGVLLILGIILSFFPSKMKKKALRFAIEDFMNYEDKFKNKELIPLQDSSRSFAFINDNNELEIHQDCALVYNIPILGIQNAAVDMQLIKKRDYVGKYPNEVPILISMLDGTKYIIKLTNLFSTNTMYSLESNKKDIKKKYVDNTSLVAVKLINAIYSKKKELHPDAQTIMDKLSSPLKHVATSEVLLTKEEKKITKETIKSENKGN